MRHWLYGKWERDAARRQDLADFEREYRHEAGLPEGPLDLQQQVSLDLALKTHELFMDRALWGEGSGEMLGISPLEHVRKVAWYDPRPLMESDPEWVEYFERVYSEVLARLEDETPLTHARRLGVPRQEVNLSREAMDLLAGALDTTLEHYGTSGDADPRGYWMPIDGDTR